MLSSAAPKAAPQHPVPGTQLDFAGGTNFRELGGYEADEGKHVKWGQIYRGIPTGLLTGAADRKLLDSLGLRLILDLRSESEAAEQPDYVPDGARLVRICGLCHPDGSEISFSPGDIEKLLKGKKDEEHNLADAMYQQMLFRNKAYKELFPGRWRRAKRRSCSTAPAGKTAPAWRPSSFCWRWGLPMKRSVRILYGPMSAAARSWKDLGRPCRGDRGASRTEAVLSGHCRCPPGVCPLCVGHHPQRVWHHRCLS